VGGHDKAKIVALVCCELVSLPAKENTKSRREPEHHERECLDKDWVSHYLVHAKTSFSGQCTASRKQNTVSECAERERNCEVKGPTSANGFNTGRPAARTFRAVDNPLGSRLNAISVIAGTPKLTCSPQSAIGASL
jgi:hypothetical protein